MATPKQNEANRRNALKSTGPRTPEGKRAVRLNSLVHGLRSQDVVLGGEDRQAFDQLREAFLDTYRPEGPAEVYCVEKMLASYWRARRIPKIEAGMFNNTAGSVNIAFTQDPAAWDGFSRLCRYETALDRAFYRALSELNRLQADRAPHPDGECAAPPEIGFARQDQPSSGAAAAAVVEQTCDPRAVPTPPAPPKKRYELAPNGKWRELPPRDPDGDGKPPSLAQLPT